MDSEKKSGFPEPFVRINEEREDLAGTLEYLAQAAQKYFRADACVIFALNPITGRFIESPAGSGQFLTGDQAFDMQPDFEEITGDVLKHNILVVSNVEATPKYQSRFTHLEHIRSFVGLTLHRDQSQKPLGVLYITFRSQRAFSDDDDALFQLFADFASSRLHETWLVWRYQQVASIGQKITSELLPVDIFFQKLQTHLAGILDISHSLLLFAYHQQTDTFDIYLQEENRFLLVENQLASGACQYAMEKRETIFIEHWSKQQPDAPFQIAHVPGSHPQEAFIFAPLLLDGEPLGVLSIQHPDPYSYTQEDCTVLELLVNSTALALHNVRVKHILSQLNETGAILTQPLRAKQTLQAVVGKIRAATSADLVVLYPFEARDQHFILPPWIDGDLLDSASLDWMSPNLPGGVVKQVLHHEKPLFARQSSDFGSDPNIHQGDFGRREQIRSTAALPLRVGEETVGVLLINFRQQQRFDATQRIFIEGLGNSAAVAIRNTQLFGNLSQRRVREQLILQHIDHQLSRTLLDLPVFLNTLLERVHEKILAEEAVIWLYRPREQELEAAAAKGPHADLRLGRIISLQQTRSITRWVFEQKKSARVANVHLDQQWSKLYISIVDEVVSELDVPLLDGEEVVGVLNFESTRPDAFSREDEEFLSTLAGQIVLALKNAQSYEREKVLRQKAEQSSAEAQALNEISKEITGQLDAASVFDLILEKALELTDATLASLHLYRPDQGKLELWLVKEQGADENQGKLRLPFHQGIVGEAAARRSTLNISDVSLPPWSDIYVQYSPRTRSEIAVPMLEGGEEKIRGVLNVESPFPESFQARDERLLRGLADLAVIALQNAERYEQAKKEAQGFAFLYKAGQELSGITELSQLDQAYETVMHIVAEHSQCPVVIRRYDNTTHDLVLINTSQPYYFQLRQRRKAEEGIHGQAIREQRMIVIHDTHNPPPGLVSFEPSDPAMRSQIIAPILFKDRYYGTLRLGHKDVSHFQTNDQLLFEGLAHQLATTIYRLETVQERQEFQERATAAEAMNEVGLTTFELVHRLENDLGLVRTHSNHIREEIKKSAPNGPVISDRLDHIVQAVGKVLHLTGRLKEDWLRWGQAGKSEWTVLHPAILLEEASTAIPLPPTISVELKIDPDVLKIRVRHSLVADILRNLMTNAVEAMANEGRITLRAYNADRFVALEVNDTGAGIPKQDQANIFKPFFSTKKSTGFGLWSARRNALSHHGDLTVRSEPDQKGATFTLFLPRFEEN